MAVRRSFKAATEGASGVLDMYIRDLFARNQAKYQSDLVQQRQKESAIYNLASQWDKLSTPVQTTLMNEGELPFSPTPTQQRIGDVVAEASKADNLSKLITDQELLTTLQGLGISTAQDEAGNYPEPVRQAMLARESRFNQLNQNQPTQKMEFVDQFGIKQAQHVPQNQIASYGALPQERTPQQEGQRTLGTFQAGEGSPAYAAAKGQVDNIVADLTGPTAVRWAARKAGATETATQNAYMAPNLVDARVDEHNRKARGTAEASWPTGAELGAGANLGPLMDAHAQALRLETEGYRIVPGAMAMTHSPTLGAIGASIPGVALSAGEKSYANQADVFTNTLGKIMSGVTVREDERDNFLSAMFAHSSDDPGLVAQKQRNRVAWLASAQMSTGRAGDVAGRALGNAILQGKLPPTVVSTLQFTNPELETAFLETVSSKFQAMQDDNGKITLTPIAGVR